MRVELKKGVNLHVIKTEKYKTIRVLIRFSSVISKETISKRTLLSSLLETNSNKYPTQQAMSEYLADLYGTSFGRTVGKKGNNHYFSVILNTVNDKYLTTQEDVLGDSFKFLKEVIFNPNFKNNQFDEGTFEREKNNLIDYIDSVYDDKQSQAALRLQEMFFAGDENQSIPSFGTSQDVAAISVEEMTEYYKEMLKNDSVDIFVIGDVSDSRVLGLAQAFPFTDREQDVPTTFYKDRQISDVLVKEEALPVTQGKLNLGYQTDTYFFTENYFALVVFNGLFGGFPHSKLFMNVREKESMAYYASSSLDAFRGYVTVQTGIEVENKERVELLIAEQLRALLAGDVSEDELQQTKKMLENQYVSSLDNPSAVIESAFIKEKYPQANVSKDKWLELLEKVTIKDVQEVAKSLTLQAVYFMKGIDEE